MNPSIYLEVVVQGVLTGLVYGLMALGLSVIFGVVRVVNFAHGEFTVAAMYAAFLLFTLAGIDPLIAMVPVAIAFFGIGYALQLAGNVVFGAVIYCGAVFLLWSLCNHPAGAETAVFALVKRRPH